MASKVDLENLNEEQKQAVVHEEGPLLIIAGAGTGKTTVVTKRIQHLIVDKNVAPSNILALTFTEKAAAEMESRTDEVLPYGYTDMWIETFHAFCDRILRQEAIHLGLDPSYNLLTEAEALLFLRKHLFEFQLDYFRPLGNPMKFLQGMLQHFSRLKDDDINPEQYLSFAEKLKNTDAGIDEIKKTSELANAFKIYEKLKSKNGVMDFADLISSTLKLFRSREHILKRYQKQFQYILVDEFQDTNYAQNEMAILLAGERKNIAVVGDDDQCLPGDTLVTTPDGQKRIKDIQNGEKVVTAVGKGSLSISTVNRVFKNTKDTTFITVKTASGASIIATSNHKMFCYTPNSKKNLVNETTEKVKINLFQCYRKYAAKRKGDLLENPLVLHHVSLETSNTNIIKLLDKHNITYSKVKKGIRVRFYSSELEKAYELAQELAKITGGFIEAKSVIATLNYVNMPAVIMPAGNLLEGLYIPAIRKNHVYYDRIISVERTEKTDIVYDLEIDKTHNFIANNIVVHNSIYRWRGAAIANMLQFRSHFPKAKIVTLTKNYRSTQAILDSAYQMIQSNNPDRLEVKEHIAEKKLIAQRTLSGDPISFILTNRADEEAEEVAQIIKQDQKKNNRQYKDYAILVRANDHATPFQRALERAKIPFQFLGPGHLYQQEEIKDLIAYLRVLANFEDTASLYRLLTMPIFDIEARDIAALLNYAKKSNLSLFATMEDVRSSALTEKGKAQVERLTTMLKKHLGRVPKDIAGQLLYYFFEDSGLMGFYLDPQTPKTVRQAENVAKFFEKLQSYAANHDDSSVFAVVDWIELSMELGESPMAADIDLNATNAVNILTVHSSKGLEFPVVFVVNLVTQRFPSRDRKEQIPVPQNLIREELPEGDENVQEERRLFYVAMTRARDQLYLTAAKYYGEGKRERKLSPFVTEALGTTYIESTIKKHAIEQNSHQLSLLDMFNDSIQNDPPQKNMSLDNPGIKNQSYLLNYISYSQIQTFDTCPLHYKLRYILHFPSPESPALSYGISVHSTLRDCFLLLTRDNSLHPDMIPDILKRNWLSQGYSSKNHEQIAFDQAHKTLTRYISDNLEKRPNPIAIELPFQFWLNKIKVGGRIDRIDQLEDGRIEIIDYKTGANLPDEKKLLGDQQLTFYALAANQVRDRLLNKKPEEIALSLYFVEANKKFTTTRTAKQLEEAKQFILDKVNEISQSDFACTHSAFCHNCEYKMLCNM